MCGVFICCLFKQKTAYELRISDWSSDVCSSDLQIVHIDGNAHIALGDRIADTRIGHRIRWLERVDLVERRMEHRRLPGIVDTGKGVGTEDLPVILRGQRDLVFWRLGQPVAHEESLSLRD